MRSPSQVGGHEDEIVIYGEVDEAAPLAEQRLARVAVLLILLDGVFDVLVGEAVLQLEGGDGQAVDADGEVEGAAALVLAVAQLAGDAEAVGGVVCAWPGD